MIYLRILIFLAVFLLSTAGTGAAYTWFSDDFDDYNNGNNALDFDFQNPDQTWSVTEGSLNLIGNGIDDIIPDHGLYVDLDSSTMMTSRVTNLINGYYKLAFDLAGNDQETSHIMVSVAADTDIFTKSYSIGDNSQFQTFTEIFKIENDAFIIPITINFSTGDDENEGILLDNVMLEETSPVPIPGSILLLGSGFIGLIGYRIKSK